MKREQKVATEIGEIHYVESGMDNQEVLLFIHGLAGSKDVWHWNLPILKNYFRCICIDLPGNGHSDDFNAPHSIRNYTSAVIYFMNALGLQKVHWFGHSMGGQIALYAALHYPDRVGKLILSSPAGFEYFTPLEVQVLKHGVMMNPFLNLDHWLLQEMYKSAFFIQEDKSKFLLRKIKEMTHDRDHLQYVRMLKESMIGMLEEQLFPKLKNIKNDMLVFFGEKDQMIPNVIMHTSTNTKDLAIKASREIHHIQLYTFSQAGHFVHIEMHEAVNEYIMKWAI